MMPDEIIRNIEKLLSLPDVVIRINALLDSESADAGDIGEVVGHDPALASQLLKLVNSAIYNLPTKIDTIPKAITLVGTRELRLLTLTAVAGETFNKVPPELLDMDDFWYRSTLVALIARNLADEMGKRASDTIFLSGLLHDCGKIALLTQQPDQESSALQQASERGEPLNNVEQEIFGFSSAEVGAALLKQWQLPESIWRPIAYQHRPSESPDFKTECQLLNLAILMANQQEPEVGVGPDSDLTRKRIETRAAAVELSVEALEKASMNADLQALDLLQIIHPGGAG